MDKNTSQHLAEPDLNRLWIASTRYYLGRSTADTHSFCDSLLKHWGNIPENTQSIIRRDVYEAVERDDRDRNHGKEHCALGHDIDSQKWRSVFIGIS